MWFGEIVAPSFLSTRTLEQHLLWTTITSGQTTDNKLSQLPCSINSRYQLGDHLYLALKSCPLFHRTLQTAIGVSTPLHHLLHLSTYSRFNQSREPPPTTVSFARATRLVVKVSFSLMVPAPTMGQPLVPHASHAAALLLSSRLRLIPVRSKSLSPSMGRSIRVTGLSCAQLSSHLASASGTGRALTTLYSRRIANISCSGFASGFTSGRIMDGGQTTAQWRTRICGRHFLRGFGNWSSMELMSSSGSSRGIWMRQIRMRSKRLWVYNPLSVLKLVDWAHSCDFQAIPDNERGTNGATSRILMLSI